MLLKFHSLVVTDEAVDEVSLGFLITELVCDLLEVGLFLELVVGFDEVIFLEDTFFFEEVFFFFDETVVLL